MFSIDDYDNYVIPNGSDGDIINSLKAIIQHAKDNNYCSIYVVANVDYSSLLFVDMLQLEYDSGIKIMFVW